MAVILDKLKWLGEDPGWRPESFYTCSWSPENGNCVYSPSSGPACLPMIPPSSPYNTGLIFQALKWRMVAFWGRYVSVSTSVFPASQLTLRVMIQSSDSCTWKNIASLMGSVVHRHPYALQHHGMMFLALMLTTRCARRDEFDQRANELNFGSIRGSESISMSFFSFFVQAYRLSA